TRNTAPSAPRNAKPWSSPNSRTRVRTGTITAMAAPSAAPDAVPSTYGSASGLRSTPWNVAPATASPAPTVIAVSTRGSRRSTTMTSSARLHVIGMSRPRRRWARIATVSPGGTKTEPAATPATSTSASTPSPRPARASGRRAMRDRPPSRNRVDASAVIGGSSRRRRWGSGGRRRGQRNLRVDRGDQRRQPVDESRPGPGHDDVVDREDVPLLDRGHVAPAGTLADVLGLGAIRGVAEEDHFGVGGDEVLEGDRVVRRAGDRVRTGEHEHLAVDRLGGRGEDAVADVDLVDEPGLVGDVRDGGRELVEPGLRVVGEPVAGIGGTDRLTQRPEAGDRLVDGGGVAHDHGDVRATELLDGGALAQACATGHDQVGTERHDLLDVDSREVRDHCDRVRLGRVAGDVLDLGDDAIADAEGEQGLGGGRGERHDLPRLRGDRDRRALV